MIEFRQVNFSYQTGTPFVSQALFGIDLTIRDGSYTALIGHTGSGKSTIIQHLNGLLKPTDGSVVVGEIAITNDSKQKDIKPVRKRVGVVFQFPETQLFDETVLKDVAFGPQNFGVSEEKSLQLAKAKLQLVDLPEEMWEKSPFEISGGQMRRVAIAGILAMEPEILVLDEPTAGLDPKARIEMMALFETIHQKGTTLVLVTHNMDDVADFADFVYLIEGGKILRSGIPQDVFQDINFLVSHQLGVPKATNFARKLWPEMLDLPITRQELVEKIKETYT
jgi:energy-coupling factor transport system ATP-binding protein